MSYYLKSKRLDIQTKDSLIFVLNEETAKDYGLFAGDKVEVFWRDISVFGTIDTTGTLVGYNELGLYQDVWENYKIPSNDDISIHVVDKTESLDAIRKKIQGGKLTYEEIYSVIKDIALRKLSTIEITYFASTSYSPGFDDEEVYFLTKAMAETGEKFDFDYLGKKIVDKHSIGGIPAKGITPILVPILACFDLIIPNTSSRAITSPAGTSDILEVLMPVCLSTSKIKEVVEKTNACMVWGGAINLAPADDVLINIERPLHIESYDKFIVSIMAKKIASGIKYFLVDMPVGKDTKIENEKDVSIVSEHFKNLGKKFNIDVSVYFRKVFGPDGNGVGPLLEARDLLYILERDPRSPKVIENLACDMAGKLLEMTDTVELGQGYNKVREKLENGECEKKFWEIALAQGAEKVIKSSELILAEYSLDVISKQKGYISSIYNKTLIKLCRILGAPFLKQAGVYFYKMPKSEVNTGDKLFTIYSANRHRIDLAKEFIDNNEIVEIK